MDRSDPFVAQASAMPAMPEVALQLLKSFERDDISLQQLASLVSRDAVLAAKALRLANSARYSPSHAIASVADAAACLGLNTLRDLALAAAMVGALPARSGFDRTAFWRLNLATGCYAQLIARHLDADAEVAYVGGLMLRTGQLLMTMVAPEGMAEVGRHAEAVDSRIGFEQALLGRAHPEVTAELARHWHFPDPLVAAFNAATAPMEVRPFCRLGAALRLASVVAEARERQADPATALQAAQPELVEHLHLDLAWLAAHLPEHAMAAAGVDTLLS